jgi:hypothetical protein
MLYDRVQEELDMIAGEDEDDEEEDEEFDDNEEYSDED